MRRREFLKRSAAGAAAIGMAPGASLAQDATLRLHQFLPPAATIPAGILRPWAEGVQKASGGKLAVQHFDAMSLGGRPPELMDQARDGVVDLVMTVVGYTPGRFNGTEVFELPFMMKDPVATSLAFWELVETDLQGAEFSDIKVLGAWVHGPGVIHSKDPVARLEDMRGKTLRGPTRVITNLLSELGATAVGMPVPAIPESISKGVIDGAVIPWEVTRTLRMSELVSNHTEIAGPEALYTAAFVLAMNKDRYEDLPRGLRAALDAESGAKLSAMAARVMAGADAPAREIAVKAGNRIISLDQAEIARWKRASEPVVEQWVEDVGAKGLDGRALIGRARTLIEKHS